MANRSGGSIHSISRKLRLQIYFHVYRRFLKVRMGGAIEGQSAKSLVDATYSPLQIEHQIQYRRQSQGIRYL